MSKRDKYWAVIAGLNPSRSNVEWPKQFETEKDARAFAKHLEVPFYIDHHWYRFETSVVWVEMTSSQTEGEPTRTSCK
jgi:hypothetical protein